LAWYFELMMFGLSRSVLKMVCAVIFCCALQKGSCLRLKPPSTQVDLQHPNHISKKTDNTTWFWITAYDGHGDDKNCSMIDDTHDSTDERYWNGTYLWFGTSWVLSPSTCIHLCVSTETSDMWKTLPS
jgi:hypothetical protein